MKTLLIDNYDSFSYNIYQAIAEINGVEPIIIKNDAVTLVELDAYQFDNIIISPGSGHPAVERDFGVCHYVLHRYDVPILGICLGHQGICCAYGGSVSHAPEPIHGQVHAITHDGSMLFHKIPEEFNVVRYHSLIAESPLPRCLAVTAWSQEKLIMGLRHKEKPVWGVQFHPESICTEYGHQLFENFRNLTQRYSKKKNTPKKKRNSRQNYSAVHDRKTAKIAQYRLLVKIIDIQLDTVDLYQKYCKDQTVSIWLDSNMLSHHDASSLSIIGCMDGPHSYHVKYNLSAEEIKIIHKTYVEVKQGDIFDFLQQELEHYKIQSTTLPFEFQCGFVGYFGYELKQTTMGVKNQHVSEHPDAQFIFLDRAIVYDHKHEKCYLLSLCNDVTCVQAERWLEKTQQLAGLCRVASSSMKQLINPVYPRYTLERNKDEYIRDIYTCLEYIQNGDSYEVCLTNRITIKKTIDALQYYLILRKINPAPPYH